MAPFFGVDYKQADRVARVVVVALEKLVDRVSVDGLVDRAAMRADVTAEHHPDIGVLLQPVEDVLRAVVAAASLGLLDAAF